MAMAVPARAGVSVGSLYRFFVDKQAIVAALTAHWLDDFVAVMDRALTDPPAELTGLADRLVDAYAAFWRDQPGFRQAWFGDIGAAVSPAVADDNDRELVDRLHPVLTARYGMAGGDELRSRLTVAVSVTEHLLKRAFKRHPDGDPVVLAELKVLLHRYLGGPARQQ